MNKEHDATAHHDDLDHLEDIKNIETDFTFGEDDENYNLGYQMGFDSGYIEGYDQGQQTLALEKESAIYNAALNDIIKQVDAFEFEEKHSVMQVLQLLQRI